MVRRGKRNTHSPFTRYAVLSQPAPIDSARAGASAANCDSMSAMAWSGVTSTSAPLIVKDKVIVGSSGGDTGMRGYVAALSAKTGEELWRTYTVPAKGEPGAETWGDLIEWGGAGTWLSGTYDPESNTLYWTTGNPWPDFTGTPRKGDNLD